MTPMTDGTEGAPRGFGGEGAVVWMGSQFLDFSGEFSNVDTGSFGFIQGKRGDGVEIELFQQRAVGAAGKEIIDGALLAVIKGAVDIAQRGEAIASASAGVEMGVGAADPGAGIFRKIRG